MNKAISSDPLDEMEPIHHRKGSFIASNEVKVNNGQLIVSTENLNGLRLYDKVMIEAKPASVSTIITVTCSHYMVVIKARHLQGFTGKIEKGQTIKYYG